MNLDATLRWLKPERKRHPLRRRPDTHLSWIGDAPPAGPPVLLDTTVYIDVLQGRSPPSLDALIRSRPRHHSAVCIAELAHALGRLDPADPRTKRTAAIVRATILDVPDHRIAAPDAETWAAAGVVAGLLFRLGSYAAGAERKCLNDSLVYLQAHKLGLPVLSGNIRDFDFLQQLVPDGRILLYRRA